MNGEAIRELVQRLVDPKTLGGFLLSPPGWVVADPAALVKPGPQAEPLAVYTLGALRDYLTANRDALELETLVVHVVSPQIVTVSGALQRARTRETYVRASALNLTDGFLDKFMPIEAFIVGLQCRFVSTDDLKRVLTLFGHVKHETVKTSADDGITQTVTAKQGVALVTEAAVPNPVTLQPFRTFREVRQPASPFVLRVQAGPSGGLPTVGLFEADGGAWRLEAIAAVGGWLVHELPPGVKVLA